MQRFFQRLGAFVAELKRRKVYRAAAVYLVAAYATIELADILLPALGAPEGTFRLVLILVAAGFPVAVLLGWMYDLSAVGLQRDPEDQRTAPSSRRRARVVAVVAAIGAALLLGWSAWSLQPDDVDAAPPSDTPALDPRRIAVLYFDDHSQDGSLGYLAAGLTESLLHELGTVEGLEVSARSSVKPFRSEPVSTDSIVSLLGVGTLVDGSVTGSGDSVRAVVHLIDGRSGTHLDSRVVEGTLEDPLAFQDSLARSVARGLRKHLGREIRMRGSRARASSADAWAAYRRGQELVTALQSTRDADQREAEQVLLRADSLLARAAALDPDWPEPPLARVGVARALAVRLAPRPGAVDTAWAREAIARANTILEEDPDAPEVLEERGGIRLLLAGTPGVENRASLLRAAEADLRRAVDLAPELSPAWWKLSEVLIQGARFTEAIDAAARAFDSDVFLQVEEEALHSLFYATLQLGPREEAVRWCDEGRRRFPENVNFVRCKLLILGTFPQVEPDVDRAWELYHELLALSPEPSRETWRMFGGAHLAQVLARGGQPDSARAVLRAVRGVEPPAHLASHEAKVHLLIGDEERAIRLLRRYLTVDPDTTYLARDWWFEGLRDNAEFRQLVGLDAGPG
jgi:TolB-like protein